MSDSEKILRQQIKDAMSSQDSVLNAELAMLEKIKEETSSQIKIIHEKIDHVPQALHQNELQYAEFKRFITEMVHKENTKINGWVTDIREDVSTKVSEQDFDRIQGDVSSHIQKLASQIDISQISVEQLRQRVLDVESQSRERLRELRTIQERGVTNAEAKQRSDREESMAKFDGVVSKMSTYPKLFDGINAEIKRIKNQVDEKVGHEISRIQRDIVVLKNEGGNTRNLDEGLENAVGPMKLRVDNLTRIVEEMKESQRPSYQSYMKQDKEKTPSISTLEQPSTIFKPAHFIPAGAVPTSQFTPYVPLSKSGSKAKLDSSKSRLDLQSTTKPQSFTEAVKSPVAHIPLAKRKEEEIPNGIKELASVKELSKSRTQSIRSQDSLNNLVKSKSVNKLSKLKKSTVSLAELESLADLSMPATPPKADSLVEF
jgi:hypothetical protein